ncbi:MAG: periplasmic heavy metal sensor, partial [Deltaproteobacteria bacterium]|nr:periplasmic heavy metal sensor [Deltaproteobacteria bacterium]
MRIKRIIEGLMVFGMLGLLLTPQGVLAMGPGGPGRMGPPHMGRFLIKLLNLTPAQQKQAIQIRAKMQEDLVDVKEKLRVKHQQLRKLWAQEDPDLRDILAKHREMEPLMRQVFKRISQMRLEFRRILTDEQRGKLIELLQKRPAFPGPEGF